MSDDTAPVRSNDSVSERLAEIDQIADASEKVEALVELASQLLPSGSEVLQQALSAALAIDDESDRAKTLAAIAHQLPATEPQLLERALSTAQAIQNEEYRAKALAAIAPQLPATERIKVWEQALSAAQSIQDESDRVTALAAIAPQLPATERLKVLEQALSAAQSIQDESSRARALAAIAPQLPETEPQLLQQALSAALAIQDEFARARALSAIAPRLPETEHLQVLEQALSAALAIQNEFARATALSAIAPQLPETEPQLLQQALSAALAIQNESFRATALAVIAPQLPEPERLQVWQQALSAAQSIQDEFARATVLVVIALLLPETEPQLLQQALSAAQSIQSESDRAEVLAEVAPQLPQDYLPQLLKATPGGAKEAAGRALISPAIRFTEALAVQFPSDKHSVALEIVKALPQDADKTKFLSALVPRLSLGLLPNALRQIQDAFTQDAYRAEALGNIVPYLPTEQLPEALKLITQSIKTSRHQTTALENLIPFLPFQELQEVLNLLEENNTEPSNDTPTPELQTKVITEPKLIARILRSVATALSTASIDSGLNQSFPPKESEEVLTPQLQKPVEISLLIDKIYKLTVLLESHQQQGFSYEKEAANILSQVAPALTHLSDQNRNYIPEFNLRFKDLGYQAQVLSVCAPYFPEAIDRFLEECRGDDYRALLNIKVQAALLNKLHTQVQNSSNLEERDELLKKRDELDTTLKTIEGPYRKTEALVEITRYPIGASYQTEALGTIRGLSNSYLKAQYFQDLIPHLLDRQRLEAADIIREILDPYYRVKAFVALACRFPEFRGEAKTSAQTLEIRGEAQTLENQNRIKRIEQLSNLAVEVPEILPEILDMAEHVKEAIERPQILVALAIHLPMRINREVDRERFAGRPISDDLWDRALYLLARGYRDALQGGSLRNESAQDKDFLNLQDEVNALADLLLMRDLEPPMTVGILGGWGGGKSYIMHLMQTHMTEVRSRSITATEAWNPDPKNEKLSPYVGHIYQIKFDAWTFAKSDLWASLMQTIFFELNRQITLELELRAFFDKEGIDPYVENSSYAGIWQVLYKSSEEDRNYFLQQVLKLEDLDQLKQINGVQVTRETAENLIWGKARETKAESLEQLNQKRAELQNTEATIAEKRNALEQETQNLEAAYQKYQAGLAQELQKVPRNELAAAIQNTLGVSGLVLRKRLGQDAFRDLQQQIIEKLPQDVDVDDLQTFGIELREAVAKVLEGDEQVLEGDEKETSFHFSRQSIKQWSRTNLTFLLVFALFAIASVLVPILVAHFNPSALVPQIVALITPLLPAIAMAQKLWRSAQKWHEQAKQALQDYENQIEIDSQRFVEKKTKEWLKNNPAQDPQQSTAALEGEIQNLESAKQQLQIDIQTVEKELPENIPASLADYVMSRIQAGTYDKQLGLMHQVKQDLTDLSRRLLPPSVGSVTTEEFKQRMQDLKEIFPRGPARVVVYIDDLDRCPPDRVVQVLEAVQLLVKTPLFIAVLAVDERYITRALEKFYEGVLSRRGRPSGIDYLEKIIQLPYRVRPIMANTLESYLRSQVVIQDSATGGAKFSEFSRQEFNLLLACCTQVDLSPRTLKRLTNVYKLFKIVCRTRGTKPSLQVQQAILALLALSGRYPDLMRGIFDSIETCFEEQRTLEKAEKTSHPLHLRSPLRDFFEKYQLTEGDRYLQREFDKLKHDALQTNILPPTLTLVDMTHEIFNLIRSFSFVGEIGEDPEDYRISESTTMTSP